MNHDTTTETAGAGADRLALAICGHRIDQLATRLAGRDDYLHTAIAEAAMELETVDQTIASAIADRRDQLHAELHQLEALARALDAGQPIAPRRTAALGEAVDQAASGREAAVAELCDQLRLARQALAEDR